MTYSLITIINEGKNTCMCICVDILYVCVCMCISAYVKMHLHECVYMYMCQGLSCQSAHAETVQEYHSQKVLAHVMVYH